MGSPTTGTPLSALFARIAIHWCNTYKARDRSSTHCPDLSELAEHHQRCLPANSRKTLEHVVILSPDRAFLYRVIHVGISRVKTTLKVSHRALQIASEPLALEAGSLK